MYRARMRSDQTIIIVLKCFSCATLLTVLSSATLCLLLRRAVMLGLFQPEERLATQAFPIWVFNYAVFI